MMLTCGDAFEVIALRLNLRRLESGSREWQEHSGVGDKAVPADGRPVIRVEKIVPARSSLACSLSYDPILEPYFSSSLLYVNYGFQVEGIPESVLSIPVLGLLAPVAWAVGATVTAGDVDGRFLASLHEVGAAMQGMYPTAGLSTDIRCTAVDTRWQEGERDCLLYSGGVDSTCSLIRNLGPKLALATVRGTPDLRLGDAQFWDRAEKRLQPFLRSIGIERQVIETNAIDIVNLRSLKTAKAEFAEGWWENLSHGLILLSHCAPFTYVGGIKRMMIAASFTQSTVEPWGSTPASDALIAWGNVTTVHDSADLSRVEKTKQVLAPYMAQHQGVVQLRVCTGKRESRLASGTLNCGVCPKCVRTMLGLMHAGIDPTVCGFPSPDFPGIKEGMISGRLVPPNIYSVRIIHASKSPPDKGLLEHYPAYGEFLSWFYDWRIPAGTERKWVSKFAPKGSRRRRLLRDIAR